MNRSLVLAIIFGCFLLLISSCGGGEDGDDGGGCGCDGCGDGCGCDGCCGSEDDESKDEDDDGSSVAEYERTSLGQTSDTEVPQQRAVSICDGSSSNTIDATATRTSTSSGFQYSYSFTMRACAGGFGYSVVADGISRRHLGAGVAQNGKETTGSNSFQSSTSYNRLCISTGDGSIGEYCIPFS